LLSTPATGWSWPQHAAGRDRFADPTEAEALIAAAPERDRAIWATAMYAGLRRGELRALRVSDVDIASGVIRVERGWDDMEGEIVLKTAAGRRKVPIALRLRDRIVEHKLATGRDGDQLLFGRTGSDAFNGKVLQDRADEAWAEAGLERITPPRVPSHLRLADDRRWRQREGTFDLHGSREHLDHPGPIRTPDAGERERGGRIARCLPHEPEGTGRLRRTVRDSGESHLEVGTGGATGPFAGGQGSRLRQKSRNFEY
jgi:hypothetical protein